MKLLGRQTSTVICVAVAFLFASSFAEAKTSMLCKVSLGGSGMLRTFVLVTLTNLTATAIPKGQTLFAKKEGKTLKFQSVAAIPENGSVTFETTEGAFKAAGDCEGWFD
jgi:hypothetical protein